MLLATGKIVTRDQFKILPMPQSVMVTLNAMAVKEGKKITQTQLHVLDDNSLDKSKMPLSTRDRWITNPHSPTYYQLTAFRDSSFRWRRGWGVPVTAEATPPSGEIGIAAVEIGLAELETIGVHERDLLTPPTPPPEPDDIPADTPAPDIEPVPQQPAQTVQSPVREQRRVPVPTERMVTRSTRTNEDAFVTNTGGTVPRSVNTSLTTHEVAEVMKRHKEEMGKSDTANISVKEAFRTKGHEAKKVIVSELRQMIDKRVWAPVMGGKLTAMLRASTIRSSMFLK